MKITIWTNGPACVQCHQTKREFDKLGIIYQERDLRRNPKAVERFKEMGLMAAPIVETDDRRWSGFRINRIRSLQQHLEHERDLGINVPVEPLRHVADEVQDDE